VALDENGKALADMGVALADYLHTGLISIVLTHSAINTWSSFGTTAD